MDNPFLSEAAFVSPSLNRLRVVDLPGIQIPGQWRGLNGYDLLSAASLVAMIEAHAAELEMQATTPKLLQAFNNCFNSPSLTVQATARQIAKTYGRHLGILLLTLERADAVNRRARPTWSRQHWQFWQSVATVHIGGGLLSGAMGLHAVASAQETLLDAGSDGMNLLLSPFAAYLSLAGLARTAPPNTRAMLLFDFGQTNIKRAVAIRIAKDKIELHPLSKISTPSGPDLFASSERELAEAAASLITDVVVQSWLEAQNNYGPLDPVVGISLACYLVNGHPPPSEMGYYGRMQILSVNLQNYLAAHIGQAIGREVQIALWHDGSAAGLAYAGSPNKVVMMLGTAIGIGFAPSAVPGAQTYEPVSWNVELRW